MKNTLIIALLFCSSCNVEGVKTRNIQDDMPDSSEHKTHVQVQEKDTSIRITEIDSILIDTTGGNEKELPGGVKIKWLKKAENVKIKKGDVIWVNYKAFLPDGRMFDGDIAAVEKVPFMVGVGMMVPGVEQALTEVRVGEIVKILVPSELGYGEKGFINVPPNSDLLFEFIIREKQQPVVTAEGLKLWVVKTDKNKALFKSGDKVEFHYMAYHKNGKLYFDSYRNHKPFEFELGTKNIMSGLNIAFSKLRKKDIAFIEIPSDLAYGKKGLKDLVPPDTDIVYYVKIQ